MPSQRIAWGRTFWPPINSSKCLRAGSNGTAFKDGHCKRQIPWTRNKFTPEHFKVFRWKHRAGRYMGCVNSSMVSSRIRVSDAIHLQIPTHTRIIQDDVVDRLANMPDPSEPLSESISPGKFIDGMLGLCDNSTFVDKLAELSQDDLYEDEEFPAELSSLSFSGCHGQHFEEVLWKRPRDLSSTPYLFVDGTSRSDVIQGILGDCWFLSACASVAKRQDLIEKVIDPSQDLFGEGYRGVLLINFWRFGEWVTVHIDDRLPTRKGNLIYASSTNENEFWVAMVEKAYAKLHGSYEALAGGHALEAFVDLTGGIAERIRITPGFFTKLATIFKHGAFITCSRKSEGKHRDCCRRHSKGLKGLIGDHAYTVTAVETVRLVEGQPVELVRVRSPWGDSVEWEGPWSDGSGNWKEVCEAEKQRLKVLAFGDGEFWISFEDFKEEFEEVTVATIGPDFNRDGLPDIPLEVSVLKSSWKAGINAGGCRNDLEKFSLNPQYLLHLEERDSSRNEEENTVVIGLMQEHRRSEKSRRMAMLPIAFFIYKTETPDERLGAEYFLCVPEEASSGDFTDCREVLVRTDLSPGYYVIIPATFHPDSETDFMIRIFALRPFKFRELMNL